MKAIYPIAIITFKEGVRHRIIFGVTIFAILLVFTSVIVSGLFMRDLLKVLLDISLSAISVAGLLIPIFYTITQFSGDIEKKTIYSILSRDISRSEYILGRFSGVSLLALILMSILLGATLVSIYISKLLYPDYFFVTLSILPIIIAFTSSFFSISLLNAVAIFWGSITTSSFLATLLTLGTYAIGQSIEDLVKFAITQGEAMELTNTTTIFLKCIMYMFPNFSSFDYKQYAAHGISINHHEFILLSVYSSAYCTILLFFAIFFFQKRDL